MCGGVCIYSNELRNVCGSPAPSSYVPIGYATGKDSSEREEGGVGTSHFLFCVFLYGSHFYNIHGLRFIM